MITLFFRFTVADFAAWQQADAALAPARPALGVKAQQVYRGIANPNDLTLALSFERIETSQVFLISEEVKRMMQDAKAGAPTIWFATPL